MTVQVDETKKAPVEYLLYKLVALVGSHKFWAMLFAVLVAYNIDIKPELQAIVTLVAVFIFSAAKTVEDVVR